MLKCLGKLSVPRQGYAFRSPQFQMMIIFLFSMHEDQVLRWLEAFFPVNAKRFPPSLYIMDDVRKPVVWTTTVCAWWSKNGENEALLGWHSPQQKKVGVEGVKTGGKNWHAPCRWWERINFFVEYVNTHTLKTLLRPKENWQIGINWCTRAEYIKRERGIKK